ncbi:MULTISPECIES: virulence VirE3 protein (VirA/G regulated protein) [Rhizobium]|uniref:Virulence VirE3 protein (VirA/G regulated protein) n=2 Tax=Rhizobium TaxID=379 RepID=K0Q443_9HYPH|nr:MULTISPECIES: virulence VirE3 protein (VirA/G regulated protein) [Rhizobium]KWV59677.1 hypothetical protein AS026_28280 [Rhizobium altiplani]CCM79810.1 virulence VirE3 protein (VirA/G regulated protein) [Rhizobium mesoamericanum STM3625]
MVSINKKKALGFNTANKRRSAKREADHLLEARLAEVEAGKKRANFDNFEKQRKYAGDIQIVKKLGNKFRGEISYEPLRNKRLRVDNPGELTRENGLFSKTKKILTLGAGEENKFHVSLLERKTWRGLSRLSYTEDGTLLAKHVKYRDGTLEEKWERDEKGALMRTRYVNRGWLSKAVSEEMSDPYRRGLEEKIYRKLFRRKGSRHETYEREDNGNLNLVDSKVSGFAFSRRSTKAVNHETSQTQVRKLGGAFSKSYRSRLDKDGNEIARDILEHRRLLNKRSAVYDDVSGKLKSKKHTVGRIFKSEAIYQQGDVKQVTKKILGVTVLRKTTLLNERERDARTLRAEESAFHKRLWQEHSVPAQSSLQKRAAIPSVRFDGGDSIWPSKQRSLETAVPSQPVRTGETVSRNAGVQPKQDLESLFGLSDDQLLSQSTSLNKHLSNPEPGMSGLPESPQGPSPLLGPSPREGDSGRSLGGGVLEDQMAKQRSLESQGEVAVQASDGATRPVGDNLMNGSSEEFAPISSIKRDNFRPGKPIRRVGIVHKAIPVSSEATEATEERRMSILASITHPGTRNEIYSSRPDDRNRSAGRSSSL